MRVIPGYPLWLGHSEEARDVPGLLEAGILAVVDLAAEERPAVLPRDLAYCRFPLVDGQGNAPWLILAAVAATAALVRSETPTLVACAGGISRSPCIASAAIAGVRGEPPAGVLAEVAQLGLADVSPWLWSEVVATMAGR